MSALLTTLMFTLVTVQASTAGWRERPVWAGVGPPNRTAARAQQSVLGGTQGRLNMADADMISNEPPQSPYFSDWNRLVSGYGSQRCYNIPREMKLCNNIGYDLMVLPNSLEHEGMDEVITQSEVWLTLVNLGCHDELERFLCSLYAPVCIRGYHEKLIQPCRDLCESVRAACLPTMTTFGLGWPDIVKCSKFPQAPQELCIPPNKQKKTRCSGCVENPTYESAIGSFCTADVVIRTKVLALIPVPSSDRQNTTHKIRTNGRSGVFKMPKTVESVTNFDLHVNCDCPILKAALTRPHETGRWLLMGKLHHDRKTVTVQHLSQPNWRNSGIKRAIREIRNQPTSLCRVDLIRPPSTHSSMTHSTRRSLPSGQPSRQPHTQPAAITAERRRRRKLRRRQNRNSPGRNLPPVERPGLAIEQTKRSTTQSPQSAQLQPQISFYHQKQHGYSLNPL